MPIINVLQRVLDINQNKEQRNHIIAFSIFDLYLFSVFEKTTSMEISWYVITLIFFIHNCELYKNGFLLEIFHFVRTQKFPKN